MIAAIPYTRVVEMAFWLGSQEVSACPPVEHECWLNRDKEPYFPAVAPIDGECAECWMTYLLQGV